MATAAEPVSGVEAREEGGFYRWYVTIVLLIGYTFSAIDSRVLTLLVQPIKKDLGLSDFEISLLQGFAFAILYSAAAIPLGRLVDGTRHRSRIITIGVLFWSAMTMACGTAKGFGQLFLARVGVGIGEATLSPTAYSLLSDYFGRTKRALAISVYALGYPIGSGLALIVGAILLKKFTIHGPVDLGFFGTLQPWQMVFVMVGLPGVIVAGLISTIREPVRRDLAKGHSGAMPLSAAFAYIRERWQMFGMLFFANALIAMLAIGVSIWYPTFLIRTYGLTTEQVGFYYGTVMLVCGVAGTLAGGWLSGRMMMRGKADANMRIVIAATVLKAIPLIVGPLMPTPQLALGFMAVGTLIGQATQGVILAAIQDVTPNQLRGQVTALVLLGVNLIGMGLGASFIAAITDFGFKDEASLRYSIVIAGAVLLPSIVALVLAGLPAYKRGLAEMSAR